MSWWPNLDHAGLEALEQQMTAAKELGLVGAARMAKMERPVRKVAHEGAVVSAEQKMAVLWATRAPAHAVAAAVSVEDQKPVAPLVARPARTQARAGPRVGGEAVLHQKSGLGWAHSALLMEAVGARSEPVTAEAAGGLAARAAAHGAAAQGKAGCPVMEVAEAVEAASAPPASRSCLLP